MDIQSEPGDSGPVFSADQKYSSSDRTAVHILSEKLIIPRSDNLIERPRLTELLRRSLSRSSATIISGRSGTGKTTLAAEFALKSGLAGWCALDSADCDWRIFSAHFAAAMTGEGDFQLADFGDLIPGSEETVIENFLLTVYARANGTGLIVLDDIHHVFDAPWFNAFFTLLISPLPFRPHLIMTSRSRPPAPLWRMRSKQALEVIDEKLLAFSLFETELLFARLGIEKTEPAENAYSSSFGRVSQILQAAEQYELVFSPV